MSELNITYYLYDPWIQADLIEIERLLPVEILNTLKEVIIYINISYRYPGHTENILGACCHQSSAWLTEVTQNIAISYHVLESQLEREPRGEGKSYWDLRCSKLSFLGQGSGDQSVYHLVKIFPFFPYSQACFSMNFAMDCTGDCRTEWTPSSPKHL